MNRYVCIHGHFYQPPRENPWLSGIEKQDSAYPFHDWNERITAECYAPNAASRILDSEMKITEIVNNYSKMSFNFGPTLLSWLEKHRPDVYEAVLEADRVSIKNFGGHGSAIAQVYNHIIMPLANRRDRETQVKWGIADFRKRFKREPEGMWLAETAADTETLEILADHGIKFTILAPRQAKEVKPPDSQEWFDVSNGTVDPRRPYVCRLPSGKSITLFFYDGPVSQDLGFGDLLKSGDNFAARLMSVFSDNNSEPELVHIATDGETYGHHQKHGDMALAYCIHKIEKEEGVTMTVYGQYMEMFVPAWEARIHDNSSWSCVHGVERWKSDCGCCSGMKPGWHQKWREPLRNALDWLRDFSASVFDSKGREVFKDPWEARDAYVDVIPGGDEEREAFLNGFMKENSAGPEKVYALKLLEMQRHALLMYTSCGWFFDELSGIETVQIIQYAARVMQLIRECSGSETEGEFLSRLSAAPSNIKDYENGGRIYSLFVKPAVVDLLRVGVHFAVTTVFEEYPEKVKLYSFEIENMECERVNAGKLKFSVGMAKMRSEITAEENTISYAVAHLGDHNLIAGVRDFAGDEAYARMKQEMKAAFAAGEIQDVIRLIDMHFESHSYSLWHLFKDEQERILNEIFGAIYRDIEAYYRQIYENNYSIMQAMKDKSLYIPKAFLSAVEYVLNADIKKLIKEKEPRADELKRVVTEIKRWNVALDMETLTFAIGDELGDIMEEFYVDAENTAHLERICEIIRSISELNVAANLWRAQNMYFRTGEKYYEKAREKASAGDVQSAEWVRLFGEAGEHLGVRFA